MYKLKFEKLTIYEVEEVYELLIQWCTESKDILSIDLVNVKKIDMTAIQLLLSTQKTCKQKSIKLELINISNELLKTIEVAGCSELLGVKQ